MVYVYQVITLLKKALPHINDTRLKGRIQVLLAAYKRDGGY